MKKRSIILLFILLGLAGVMIAFSQKAKAGAEEGFLLAENTILPSLLPLLIIFLLIMKTNAREALTGILGWVSVRLFRLPSVTIPAIILGLIGGYPTGAILTRELYANEEIDSVQAKRIMAFNFSGGCGFIITAIGSVLNSTKAGAIIFTSCTLSSIIIGMLKGAGLPRITSSSYSYREDIPFDRALVEAVDSAVSSTLMITAYIILFSAIKEILNPPRAIVPLLEITNGVCTDKPPTLPLISAYLTFGGLCIHLQILGMLKEMGVHYFDFLIWRIIGSVLSFMITKGLLLIIPIELQTAINSSIPIRPFSVNIGLSILLIIGCFVLIQDLSERKRVI